APPTPALDQTTFIRDPLPSPVKEVSGQPPGNNPAEAAHTKNVRRSGFDFLVRLDRGPIDVRSCGPAALHAGRSARDAGRRALRAGGRPAGGEEDGGGVELDRQPDIGLDHAVRAAARARMVLQRRVRLRVLPE